jgi:predicted dienelactone hydrolase
MRIKLVLTLLALLAPATARAVTVCDATWTDASRQRAVPVRIRLPDGQGKVPVVLFSHGLGGTLDSGTDWTESWTAAGIATITMQHAGSDRSILTTGIAAAMSPMQLIARARDVRFVLDEIGRRKTEGKCNLARIDMARIGMSGHSFGAITTFAAIGQAFALPAARGLADPRIKAAIAFSPSPPMRGHDDAAAFGNIHIPVMSLTGTADFVAITPSVTPADRQRPFRAMPPGDKYLLVLAGANHMQFNGQSRLRDGTRPDPHMRALTISATTAFWRATLLDDADAAHWLTDPMGLRRQLAAGDTFEQR